MPTKPCFWVHGGQTSWQRERDVVAVRCKSRITAITIHTRSRMRNRRSRLVDELLGEPALLRLVRPKGLVIVFEQIVIDHRKEWRGQSPMHRRFATKKAKILRHNRLPYRSHHFSFRRFPINRTYIVQNAYDTIQELRTICSDATSHPRAPLKLILGKVPTGTGSLEWCM